MVAAQSGEAQELTELTELTNKKKTIEILFDTLW